MEDLEQALNRSSPRRPLGSGSCSALLKLLPGRRDLLVAHDTWAPYQTMLRIVKKYTLPFRVAPGGAWAGWGGLTFPPPTHILTLPPPHSLIPPQALLRSRGASKCFPPTPAPSSPEMTSTS